MTADPDTAYASLPLFTKARNRFAASSRKLTTRSGQVQFLEVPYDLSMALPDGPFRRFTAPIFLLMPQVKLSKRLDLGRDAERAHDAVPGQIVANWLDER